MDENDAQTTMLDNNNQNESDQAMEANELNEVNSLTVLAISNHNEKDQAQNTSESIKTHNENINNEFIVPSFGAPEFDNFLFKFCRK
jgi:hypothetical protein